MSSTLFAILFFFGVLILIILAIFILAYFTNKSRKTLYNQLLNEIKADVNIYHIIHYNQIPFDKAFFKNKIDHNIAVLYVQDNNIIIRSINGFQHTYKLDQLNLEFIHKEERKKNGLIKQVVLNDDVSKMYIRINTKKYFFEDDLEEITTKALYDILVIEQLKAKNSLKNIKNQGQNEI